MTEIALLAALLLLFWLGASSASLLTDMSALLRDQILAEESLRVAKNGGVASLLPTPMPGQYPISCFRSEGRAGALRRSVHRCDLFARGDGVPRVWQFDRILAGGMRCPGAGSFRSLPQFHRRSHFLCRDPDPDSISSSIFNGDLYQTRDIVLQNRPDPALLAARGSIYLSTARLSHRALIVSLGDITIGAIDSIDQAPVQVLLIAPIGSVTLSRVSAHVTVSVSARKISLPDGISPVPWTDPIPLPATASARLGLFAEPLGVTP